MENSRHHLFGPSSLERRELCPASFRLEADLPDIESEDAKNGTLLHKQIALEIETWLSTGSEYKYTGTDGNIEKMMNKYLEIVHAEDDREFPVETFAELPVSYRFCGIEQYCGTSDVVIAAENKVIVIDWKTGHRPVEEAADNIQGAAYALAAMQMFDRETADVHFYNPVIGQYSCHTFTNKNGIRDCIMGVIAACKRDAAPAIPGEKQCRYCKAMSHGTCPALSKTTDAVAVEAEKLVPLPSLSELSTESLVELKHKCDLIAKLSERVDNRIKSICESAGACGPYRLKESSGGREISDISGAFGKCSDLFTPEQFLEFCTLSVAKLEKGYARTKKDSGEFKTEKEAKINFGIEFSGLIQMKPAKKTLIEAQAGQAVQAAQALPPCIIAQGAQNAE